jgi:hypothetical protein
VSSDVLITFLFHLPPAERGLVSGQVGEATYWAFPPDYEARLPGVMARLRTDVTAQREKVPVAR